MRALLLCVLALAFISILKADETGYVNKISVKQGDTLEFHISTQINPFNIKIFKYNNVDSLVTTISTIPGGARAYPDSSFYYGCNWPVSYSIVIPDNWLPGVYYAEFPTSVGSKDVVFMISPRVRGSYSKILYLSSANTWQAYNPIGGKSLYSYNSSNGVASYKVSFQRPGRAYGGYPEFFLELPFIRWMYRNNISFECAVNYDIHSDPNLLSHYKVMVVDGHSEYWSNPEKTETENFVTSGGNLIILSGNTCWWQVRYENNGNTLVCYKDPSVDPLNGIIDSLVTYNWHLSPVNSPENYMTGLSYLGAGYVNDGSILPASAGYGGYTVYNHHSWIYNGTGLMEGEDLGYSDAIVGDETDGGLFNFVNGIPAFTGTDGSPTNFMVLGLSPAYSTWGFNPVPRATFGIFHKQGGGTVFNAATNNWSLGLDSNYYVQKITKNVLDKFTANNFPPDIISWSPFNVETDFIHHENIPLNKRNFLKQDTSTINLSVNAVDPYSGSISYRWLVNNLPSGNSSSTSVNNSQFSNLNKVNKVKALVYNGFDTSEISWNYFKTQLAIYSDPVTNVNINSTYLYRINLFNNYNDSLTITTPGAPSWLSLTSAGELKGTAPVSAGVYSITIIVTNQHAQADTQSFNLTVVDPSIIVTTYQLNITALIGGFFNGTKMQPDTITVELRNNTAPYVLVDSKKVFLDTTGKGIGQFTNPVNNVPYFIVVKHRNAIETWSASPQTFNNKTMVYDFTSSQSQAYGNNLAVKNGKWCVYNGDVNQDGIVDGTDIAAVDNANNAFSTGYLATDLNGDGIIDGSDLAIVDNNNNAFIATNLPPGAPNTVNKKRINTKNPINGSNRSKDNNLKINNQ